MALRTNRELKEIALGLGLELGVEVTVDGLNNAALTELVGRLEAQKGGSAAAPAAAPPPPATPQKAVPPIDGADDSVGGPPKTKAKKPKPRYPLSVARGRAVTSPRGILADGMQVRDGDFVPSVLQQLIDTGLVVDQRNASEASSPPKD